MLLLLWLLLLLLVVFAEYPLKLSDIVDCTLKRLDLGDAFVAVFNGNTFSKLVESLIDGLYPASFASIPLGY